MWVGRLAEVASRATCAHSSSSLWPSPSHLGYVALAGLVGLESMGVPVPGETALLAAGILAQQGHLKIEFVIAVAAGAAVAGDNLGYLLGRK
jgi:membrane protein DedA with SNARE-associated domain